MTSATLKNHSYKDLAQMAKKHGVPGWHSMRKDQLVNALAKSAKKSSNTRAAKGLPAQSQPSKSRTSRPLAAKAVNAVAAPRPQAPRPPVVVPAKRRSSPMVRQRILQLQAQREAAKNLANVGTEGAEYEIKDRLVVMVRDPYWLHVYWELTRQSVIRVQAAMGQRWHTAKPTLRLFEVTSVSDSTASDTLIRSIPIHGGVNNWYIDVQDPPKGYRVDIGYQASDGTFYSITRSNLVNTPPAASRDTVDKNWVDVAENFDRIYAMSGGYSPEGGCHELRELLEERLRRPMGSPVVTRYGGAPLMSANEFHFDVDAELIIFGSTRPDAHVMLKGEPVQVRSDGTFTVRLNLPDGRQVIPVVASSADGVEQRTIALAFERNTKQMEAVLHDTVG